MTKGIKRYIAIVFSVVLLGSLVYGCAAIFKGTSNTVNFASKPLGAEVYVDGFPRGTTPLTLKLESKRPYQVEFRKEGYQPRTYTITNRVDASWIILDVIFGIFPVIVDASTGAWYELDVGTVNMVMEEQK